ncbi:MAG: DUF362 domain-containing protein [Alphaproteobacteria bacterium]|nr:DUF362 domain-containing protein [Alphaproteobacteria bacterium]
MAVSSQTWRFERGEVHAWAAWTVADVREAVEAALERHAAILPQDRAARVLIKPNLNNDLVALVGNSADLRLLDALLSGLRARGYTDLTVADGSNVGVDRRDIDAFRRLRVDRLAQRHGAGLLDLNRSDGVPISLHAGARPHVAHAVMDADFLISVPKIKTHAEAGLSCAMKNWVGICTGQDKREMHRDLGANIFALNEAVKPDLILVDGLVGMEGNGPGDGQPIRVGRILSGTDAFLNDLVVARMVGLPWTRVPYLVHAMEAGVLTPAMADAVERAVPLVQRYEAAPRRSRLAELSEARSLRWLKLAVRPLVERPAVAQAAYRLRVIQDVYDRTDDTARLVGRDADACGDCRRCEDFCPTGLPLEQIGRATELPDCVQCLYCWWVCPNDALKLEGELNHLERQVRRYKEAVEHL